MGVARCRLAEQAAKAAFFCELRGGMPFETLSRSEPPSIALELGHFAGGVPVKQRWRCWRRRVDNYFSSTWCPALPHQRAEEQPVLSAEQERHLLARRGRARGGVPGGWEPWWVTRGLLPLSPWG